MFGRRKPKAPERKYRPEPVPPVAIGQRFRIMDIDMLCVRHSSFAYEGMSVVQALYKNDEGCLCYATFPPADWAAIEAEQARGGL